MNAELTATVFITQVKCEDLEPLEMKTMKVL